ncbi:MAG: ABC transporter permease [bacterium]
MRQLGPLRFEHDPESSLTRTMFVSALAIAAAFLVAGLIFWAYGVNPLRAYRVILVDTLADPRALPEIFVPAIPLLLAGIGLLLAFRAQFYNIGAEGQLLAGTVAATWIAVFTSTPGPLMLPMMFITGFLAGALWGLLPSLLKLRLNVNEVITTLMMNYIALYAVSWLVTGPWKGPSVRGFAYTDTFPDSAWLPYLSGTRIHWPTLLLGIALAIFVAFLLNRTRFGFEIRVQGHSPEAARYAGINPLRTTLLVMLISGGFAGLAGVGEVAGIHHKLLDPSQVSLGYGYVAIIAAWLARGNPLAVIVTAVFFGLIYSSGDVMQVSLQMPARVTDVFNGLILFFLIGSERLLHYRVRWMPTATNQTVPATLPEEQAASGSERWKS